jgi:predicted glutamine amidotransferase
MCGLIGAFNYKENKESVNEWVQNKLQDQLKRGKDGFGIIFIDDKNEIKLERATDLVKPIIDLKMHESRSIIMHHRTPTSTNNLISQTHPILVDNKDLKNIYLVIHNGIVINEDELKKKHEEMGFKYNTECLKTNYYQKEEMGFNDSECVAIEVALVAEGKKDEIDTEGSIAFIALEINKKTNKATRVIYGRNDGGSPLKMSQTRNQIRLNSEGGGQDVIPNKFNWFDLKEFKIKSKDIKFKKREYKPTTNASWQSKPQTETYYDDDETCMYPKRSHYNKKNLCGKGSIADNETIKIQPTSYDVYGLPKTDNEEINNIVLTAFEKMCAEIADAVDTLLTTDETEDDREKTIEFLNNDIADDMTNIIIDIQEINKEAKQQPLLQEPEKTTAIKTYDEKEEEATIY